jgi:hypothetical protein
LHGNILSGKRWISPAILRINKKTTDCIVLKVDSSKQVPIYRFSRAKIFSSFARRE